MFIQVIQGKVRDEAGLQRCMDRWQQDLMPGATGYLGTTAGTCDDGTFVALARFESPEAAQANSARPEQGEWWAETEKCFDGAVTFMDCSDARPWMGGGSDEAGFVQIMEGRSDDVGRMHELMSAHSDEIHQARPEILGGVLMDVGEGKWVDAFYFTTEDDARHGEQRENLPDDARAAMEEGMRLMGEVSYFDLHHPMLVSAAT